MWHSNSRLVLAGAERIDWTAEQLARLAEGVGRSLHIVVRATSRKVLRGLVSAFAQTTVIDTTCFIKAVHRQRAIVADTGKIEWRPWPTAPNVPVDELLSHNWSIISRSFDSVFGKASALHVAE